VDDAQTAIATLALVAGLAWASGLRLYLTLFIFGLIVRYQVVALPAAFDILGHPWVLTASAIMLAAEFFADKIPGFDSIWDGVHTFIRIPAGAILAGVAIGHVDPVLVAVSAILGGALAAGTHIAKSGMRVLINTSPEPFSNWAASLGEETFLLGGLWMMIVHPVIFLATLMLFVLLLAWLVPRVFRAMRGLFRPRSPRAAEEIVDPHGS